MPKSLFVRDLLNLEHVFFGCIMIAESTLKFLRSVFFHHLMIIALIIGLGLVLIGIRWLVFLGCATPKTRRPCDSCYY